MKKRILIVDDEPEVARAYASLLGEAGYAVLGPAHDVSEALRLIADERCDGALVDVNLGSETSAAVASALKEHATPFVALTDALAPRVPAAFNGAPRIAKPCSAAVLIQTVHRLFADERTQARSGKRP